MQSVESASGEETQRLIRMSSAERAIPKIVYEDEVLRFYPDVQVITIDKDMDSAALVEFLLNPQKGSTHLLLRVGERGPVLGALLQITEYELLNAAAALAKNPDHYMKVIQEIPPVDVISPNELFD